MIAFTGTNFLIHVFGEILQTLNRYTVACKPVLHQNVIYFHVSSIGCSTRFPNYYYTTHIPYNLNNSALDEQADEIRVLCCSHLVICSIYRMISDKMYLRANSEWLEVDWKGEADSCQELFKKNVFIKLFLSYNSKFQAARLIGALTVFIIEIVNSTLIICTVRSIRRQKKRNNQKIGQELVQI